MDKARERRFKATGKYFKETKQNKYLWLNNKPLNYDISKVQNSQDLPDVMKLTFGISILARKTMLERKNVVGNDPMFYVLEDEETVDIDTPLDFEFAAHLYKNRK